MFPQCDDAPADDICGEKTGRKNHEDQKENSQPRIAVRDVAFRQISHETIEGDKESLEDEDGSPDRHDHQQARQEVAFERELEHAVFRTPKRPQKYCRSSYKLPLKRASHLLLFSMS